MENQYGKFKRILREMFQMDQADLDFGIYRIMNQKRDEIEKFLDKDLLPQVQEEFAKLKDVRAEEKKTELKELEEALRKAKVDPEQNEEVKKLREEISSYGDEEALAAEAFSSLATFFRRYYDGGDFLSLRRYKKDTYAIPYEGEEVKLHWANADQFYIKSSEYLKDYIFKLDNGKRVHFKVIDATQEKDNVKEAQGKERRFKLYQENPLKIDKDNLFINFVYLPDKEKQEKLNEKVVAFLTKKSSELKEYIDIFREVRKGKDKKWTLLEKQLNTYTARFNFDFFIHKNLKEFLTRELDFYLKNEVLYIDDLDEQDVQKLKIAVTKAKTIKHIAHKIIDMLSQLEEFQKKLWLKKKFVTDCGYCITVDRIPEDLYEEIAKNDSQIEDWVKLFAIDEIKKDLTTTAYSKPLTVEFLKENPFLVLDTKHFDEGFKEKLLSHVDNIDDSCDGVLINSENFQALSLLEKRYWRQVNGVHIDPPYNTATSGFLYKNEYQHSSWLSFMADRIVLAQNMLSEKGLFQCHIDENEYESLFALMEYLGIPNSGTLVWDKKNPMLGRKGVATQHEYVLVRSFLDEPVYMRNKKVLKMLSVAKSVIEKNGGVTDEARSQFSSWVMGQKDLSGGEKAYRLLEDDGRVYRGVAMGAPEPRKDPKFHIPLIHPTTKKECPVPSNGWSRTPETLKELIDKDEILWGADHSTQPQKKVYLTVDSRRQLASVLEDAKSGKAFLDCLGLYFPYCHPVSLYEELLGAVQQTSETIFLDYFAGSGTSGQAAIALNRDDGGRRKYILIEMGQYFDTVLKPRIQKVIYSKDWKDGKPVSQEGSSHMFKYMKLESYEDTLDNLIVKRSGEQQTTLDAFPQAKEGYMLHYWLDIETKGSDSLLNIDKFEDPFNYVMKIRRDNELKEQKIDLIETFSYLIGLYVKQTETIRGFKVIRGNLQTGEKVLVIWRDVNQKDNDSLNEFFSKQGYNTLDFEFDRIYVNGDNNLENLRVDEDKWKVIMIEDEFRKRMFDIQEI